MACFFNCVKPNGTANETIIQSDIKDDSYDASLRRFSWSQIEKLTSNFSKVIGSGGYSTVFLARFSSSKQGAVKIHSGSDRLNQVFRQERDILSKLQHQNIVKLLGFCDDREEGALVFEHIPNGNLRERLQENSEVLPWRNRMNIIFQVTTAIEYLHQKCSLQIIHGDVKSSNVLLDENLNCKLCDFGSAKMGFSSMVGPPNSRKQVMIGSPGYTDPHYLRTGVFSKKNDIYSLGVLILELVTGIEAFCPVRRQMLTTVTAQVVREVVAGEATMEKVKNLVDPRLQWGEFDIEEAKALILVAALCLANSPTQRPSATQILETIKRSVCLHMNLK